LKNSDTTIPQRTPRPPSYVDFAVDAVRAAIVDGAIKPGERIKELPLADRLGISRGPIRDALKLLERDGLVELIPNRGAVVPEVHALDVLEVYALRASLGSLALHKLMLEGPVPVKQLERQLNRMRTKNVAEGDLGYQAAIIAAAQLPRALAEFERLTWQVRIFIASLEVTLEDKTERIIAEVEALHAAIVARDTAEAERLWRVKFEHWVRDLIELLPEPFDHGLWSALTSARTP
jgi:DNA-binding GntR family transcriptional regulator